jgi:hypothetical protein
LAKTRGGGERGVQSEGVTCPAIREKRERKVAKKREGEVSLLPRVCSKREKKRGVW